MKASDVITLVRPWISDEGANPRWDDATLLRYISAGERAIWGVHPEAFSVETILTDRPAEITDANTDLNVSDDYATALAHYASAMVFSEDSEDGANIAESKNQLELFAAEM